ncbi:MAG: M56 family metallopeptidase [Actinomycetota bacterium]|nr:M56 family metallopeptidase [Actinomycetota bacterium]
MSPRFEATILAGLAGISVLTTVFALVLTALVFAGRHPLVAGLFGWCERLSRALPWWVGLPATLALIGLLFGGGAVTVRFLQARPAKDAPGVLVVGTDLLLAYSVAGRAGQIVVSNGLLARLTPDERRVVFAHEAAHLRLRHHRLLWLADIAALNPLLRPTRARLRFALERWADEEAVGIVGDRNLVARAIAAAALVSVGESPRAALGVAGSGVVERVEALLRPASVSRPVAASLSAVAVMLGGALLTVAAVPVLAHLITHLCGV